MNNITYLIVGLYIANNVFASSEEIALSMASNENLEKQLTKNVDIELNSEEIALSMASNENLEKQLTKNVDIELNSEEIEQIIAAYRIKNPKLAVYILKYFSGMIAGGYKKEFAVQVCQSMTILHESGIESLLSKTINITKTVEDKDDMNWRKILMEQLKSIMESNGADYEIIKEYLLEQKASSWSKKVRILKGCLLTQLVNTNDSELRNRYYTSRYAIPSLKREFSNIQNKEQYLKSIVFYKAFTALTLKNVCIPGFIQHEIYECILKRGVNSKEMKKNYPTTYGQNRKTGIIKNGIADSAAFGLPASKYRESGNDILTMNVHFSRLFAVFFVSPELCCDESIGLKKSIFGFEHEAICDLSDLDAAITPGR